MILLMFVAQYFYVTSCMTYPWFMSCSVSSSHILTWMALPSLMKWKMSSMARGVWAQVSICHCSLCVHTGQVCCCCSKLDTAQPWNFPPITLHLSVIHLCNINGQWLPGIWNKTPSHDIRRPPWAWKACMVAVTGVLWVTMYWQYWVLR